ncbi:hypothetical protein MAFF211271_40550 (plasmid) [Ralstonia syzygii subsp. indonesiensis]|nr:hypothetical protein MAFF211271_40550 [Ralstonia pseudosolanacearum]
MPGRAGADRWQRPRLVRGSRTGLYAAGVRRRRDRPADAAAVRADRVDTGVFHGHAGLRGYLLADTAENRKLAGRYIDVYHYPDGRIEPRANGAALPYTIYDKLSEVDQGAIVDNKRLGHVLQLAQYVQEKRDNRRSQSVPTTDGTPRKRGRPPGKKSQQALDQNDMLEALQRLQKQPWPLNGTQN